MACWKSKPSSLSIYGKGLAYIAKGSTCIVEEGYIISVMLNARTVGQIYEESADTRHNVPEHGVWYTTIVRAMFNVQCKVYYDLNVVAHACARRRELRGTGEWNGSPSY
jgi:hypothetical protein